MSAGRLCIGVDSSSRTKTKGESQERGGDNIRRALSEWGLAQEQALNTWRFRLGRRKASKSFWKRHEETVIARREYFSKITAVFRPLKIPLLRHWLLLKYCIPHIADYSGNKQRSNNIQANMTSMKRLRKTAVAINYLKIHSSLLRVHLSPTS